MPLVVRAEMVEELVKAFGSAGELNELSDYPVLRSIVAGRVQVPARLDDRACRYLYTAHMPTAGWSMMGERERSFARALGVQENDNNKT